MAKSIATITGTALRPGVSKNRRWYKPEHIAGAVTAAQERIAGGGKPMVMLTFHGAEDDSKEIAASLTSAALTEDGRLRFSAELTDTPAGWNMASLADTSDGKPAHLKNVSIRGAWTGKVRRERGPDGQMVETGDGLELDGIDFTKSPGVEGAEIETFAWAAEGQNETEERVLITESVEAAVTFTEGVTVGERGPELIVPNEAGQVVPNVPDGVREALELVLGPVWEGDGATPAMSKRSSGLSGGGRKWADPGYQADKRQRYDITTKQKALTAWRYINQASKAAKYTGAQLKQVKARIRAALKGFGVSVSTESAPGWGFSEPYQVTEAVAEFYGDPSKAGSWSVSASNGPVNLNLSSYGMDPADLGVVVRAAADAACKALAALDPDMDGDVDVPGAGSNSDTDGDSDGGETEPPAEDPATEDEPADDVGETDPAPAGPQETEDGAMPTESTNESGAGAQSGLTLETVQTAAAEAATAAVTGAFAARDKAAKERKKERKARKAQEAAQKEAAKALVTEALKELGVDIPAKTAEGSSADAGSGGVTETEDQRVERLVGEAILEFKQGLVISGIVTPERAGIVVTEHAPTEEDAAGPEDLVKMPDDDFQAYLGAAQNAAVTTAVPQL